MTERRQPSPGDSAANGTQGSIGRRGWGRLRRVIVPSAIVGGSLAVSLAIYFGILAEAWAQVLARWTARWTSAGLNILGQSTRVDGTLLSSDSFAVNIVAECTPVGPLVLFIGAVIAYPAPLRAKGVGVAMGFVALTLVNLVRIMSLFWLGSAFPQYLGVAHLLVWQTAIVLFAIVLWLFWAERMTVARHL